MSCAIAGTCGARAPSRWVILSSVVDIVIITVLAGCGVLMHALAWPLIVLVLVASALFALILDGLKSLLFAYLRLDERESAAAVQ